MTDLRKLLTQTKKLSLLIVEDYTPLLDEMNNMLSDYFQLVEVASNGIEALELYNRYYDRCGCHYDIIISDIEMPLMDGIEFTKKVREIDDRQRIIILSAHTDSRYLLDLINLSISHFIPKPIEIDTLFEVIHKLTEEESISDEKRQVDENMVDLGEGYIWIVDQLLLQDNGKTVKLSRSMLLLMQLMVEKSRCICTNENILQHFYTHNIDISENNIRHMVYKLRKKLPKDTIDSCYGIGYKLTPHP